MVEGFTSYIVDNDKSFRAAIARANSFLDDLTIPFTGILKDFYRSEAAIFKLGSAGQYPDYKNGGQNSKYAKYKLKHAGFIYPLLVGPSTKNHTGGALAASLLDAGNPGAVSSVGKQRLIFGTSVKYGIYHQSDEPRNKIPLRKFLFIGPEAPQFANSDQAGRLGRWNNIMNDFVLAKMRQSKAFT